MGRWTYYSPFFIGGVAAALVYATYRPVAGGATWQHWAWLVLVGIQAGIACQIVMLGAQGAFAQVLPAPGGRSIRGSGAMLAGWLILIGVVLAAAAGLLAVEGVSVAAAVVGCVALLVLLGAVATYLWLWPTAIRDFAEER